MSSQCLATIRKSLFKFTQVAFLTGPEAINKLKVPCEPLEHRFLDFIQFAFWAGQQEENGFPEHGDHLKHRFLEHTKDEFWARQDAENEIAVLCNH